MRRRRRSIVARDERNPKLPPRLISGSERTGVRPDLADVLGDGSQGLALEPGLDGTGDPLAVVAGRHDRVDGAVRHVLERTGDREAAHRVDRVGGGDVRPRAVGADGPGDRVGVAVGVPGAGDLEDRASDRALSVAGEALFRTLVLEVHVALAVA